MMARAYIADKKRMQFRAFLTSFDQAHGIWKQISFPFYLFVCFRNNMQIKDYLIFTVMFFFWINQIVYCYVIMNVF